LSGAFQQLEHFDFAPLRSELRAERIVLTSELRG
jgi:hypothetical protein